MNIKDLVNLAGEEGKVVVLGDDGEVKGIFLVYNEYQKLAAIKPIRQEAPRPDPELINREILKAQLSDTVEVSNKNLETIEEPTESDAVLSSPQPLGNLLSKRAQEIFGEKPFGNSTQPLYDMRSEVIDPSFGRPPLQPVVESDNDEEIKTDFEDI
jgi:hypothetical protein